MSSSAGTGVAAGARDLDLNCDTDPILDSHETVCTGNWEIESKMGKTKESSGDCRKEGQRGVSDQEGGTCSNGDVCDGSDLDGESESVVGSIIREAGIKSHAGKLLEVDLGEKGGIELDVLSTVRLECVEASSQTVALGKKSTDYQEQVTEVDAVGMNGTEEEPVAILVGGVGAEDEKFEDSKAQVGLEDDGVAALDGKSHGVNLLEVVTGDNESSDRVPVLAEVFEAVDFGNHSLFLEDDSGCNLDMSFEAIARKVKTYNGKFLVEDKREEGSSGLSYVSTERFGSVEASCQPMDFHSGSCGARIGETYYDVDRMVRNDELGSRNVEEVISLDVTLSDMNTKVNKYTGLATTSVEESKLGTGLDAKGAVKPNEDSVSISGGGGGKTLESNKDEKGSKGLITISTELFEPVKARKRAVGLGDVAGDIHILETCFDVKRGAEINDDLVSISGDTSEKLFVSSKEEKGRAELVASSTEGFELVMTGSQPIDSVYGYVDAQMKEVDVDSKCPVGFNDDSASISVRSGRLLAMEREEQSNAELFVEPVKASTQAADLAVEYCNNQMIGSDADANIRAGSNEDLVFSSVDTGAKLSELGWEKKGFTDQVVISTEVFEPVKISSQAKELKDLFGDFQMLGNNVYGKRTVGISDDSLCISSVNGLKLLDLDRKEIRNSKAYVESYGRTQLELSTEKISVSATGFEGIEASNQATMNLVDGSCSEKKQEIDVDAEGMDTAGQLNLGERGTEIKSHIMKILEANKGDKSSVELIAISTEGLESIVSSSNGMHFGDGSDDQKRGTDLAVEPIAIYCDLGFEVGLQSHGGNFLDVDRQEKQSAKLFSVSTGWLKHSKDSTEDDMDLGDCDKRLGNKVDELVTAIDSSVVIYDANEGCEDERLEHTLVLREEHIDVQHKLVNGSNQIVELSTAKLGGQVRSSMEKYVEDIGEKESTKVISASAECPEVVVNSCQTLDLEDGYNSEKQETDADAGVVGNENTSDVSVGISLNLGNKQILCLGSLVEESEAVEACSQSVHLKIGSGGDQRLETDVDVDCMVRTNEDSFSGSGTGGRHRDEIMEGSELLKKGLVDTHDDLLDARDEVLDDFLGSGKRESGLEPNRDMSLEMQTGEIGSAERASVSAEGYFTIVASCQDMDLEDGYSSEQKQVPTIFPETAARFDENSVTLSVNDREPADEMLEGSSRLAKEVTGEEISGTGTAVEEIAQSADTNGTETAMKYLAQPIKTEDTGVEAMVHDTQNQADNGDNERLGFCAEVIVGTNKEVPHTISAGDGGPEDVKLETPSIFEENWVVSEEEDDTGTGSIEKKKACSKMERIDAVDATRKDGHGKHTVYMEHVEILVSRERLGGDFWSKSCLQAGADPLVSPVSFQVVEAQGLEGATKLNSEPVHTKFSSEESHLLKETSISEKKADSVNVDVIECHSYEREREMDDGSNQSEVNSDFSARGEDMMMDKGLICLPECVESACDFMAHHALEGTVVKFKKQEVILENFQGAMLELRESGLAHHSLVSKQVDVYPKASSVENHVKVCDEDSTVAEETVRSLDAFPTTEQDLGPQLVDEATKAIFITGNAIGDCDVMKISMTLKEAVNLEALCAGEHAVDDNLVEKHAISKEICIVSSIEQLNNLLQNPKEDSSLMLVPLMGEEACLSDKMNDCSLLFGSSIPKTSVEQDNESVSPQPNEPSIGCQDLLMPNAPCMELDELEARHVVDEANDCCQSLQNGTYMQLKKSDNQIDGCNDRNADSCTKQQATYNLSFPERAGFSTSDLVWGKVKSHPWWPGQIFDFSGASKLALKYQKKDHFLVAYFGDKTFAWCEESRLKPFHLYFSQMEMQTASESFLCALNDVLLEVSRRVELSMTCLCLPEETYSDIEYQKVENAGVRGKSISLVIDRYEVVNYFHPDKLLEYIKDLAQLPTRGADRLELTVAQAQLKAYYLSKGYTELPSFTNGSGLVENDFRTPASISKNQNEGDLDQSATLKDLFSTKGMLGARDGKLGKHMHKMKDGRKQKKLSELMEEEATFRIVNENENASEVQDDERHLPSGNKRKTGYLSCDIERIRTKKFEPYAHTEAKFSLPTYNSAFKVGEFISRAASKLTCGQPIRKCHGEKTDDWTIDHMDADDFLDIPFDNPKLQIDISEYYPPANEMLSKLCLAARNPLKGYNFSSIVISFFSAFRNLQVSKPSIEIIKTEKPRTKRGRKKRIIPMLEDAATPDHMKDSYWSDMIVPEKDAMLNHPKRRGRKKRKCNSESLLYQMLNAPSDCDNKLHTGSMCPHVKQIYVAERPIISVEEKIVDERTPTAMILHFNCSDSLPSDTDLIRTFSRFGPLKEGKTSIETKYNSAMVVFKKRADAEMAFSSAGKFSTFGPALLSYRLKHFPFESLPANTLNVEDDVSLITHGTLGISDETKSERALGQNPSVIIPPVQFDGLKFYCRTHENADNNSHVDTRGPGEISDTPKDVPAETETDLVSDHMLPES